MSNSMHNPWAYAPRGMSIHKDIEYETLTQSDLKSDNYKHTVYANKNGIVIKTASKLSLRAFEEFD